MAGVARRLRARATSPTRSAPASRRTSRAAPTAAPRPTRWPLVARLLPHADPERFGPAPHPPRRARRAGRRDDRGRATTSATAPAALRFGLALSGATAAVAAAVLAIFVLPGGGGQEPEQHVAFRSLPPGMKIAATLEPHTFGTEIHMYVSGVRSGTLCRVFLRGPDGARRPGRHLPLPLGRRRPGGAQLRPRPLPRPRRSASAPATRPSSRRSATPTRRQPTRQPNPGGQHVTKTLPPSPCWHLPL